MELLCIGEVEPLEKLQGCRSFSGPLGWRAYKISFTSGFYRENIPLNRTRKPRARVHSRLVWFPKQGLGTFLGLCMGSCWSLPKEKKNRGKFFCHRAYCPISTYIVDSKTYHLVLLKIKYTINRGCMGINLEMRVIAIWRALRFPCSYSTTTSMICFQCQVCPLVFTAWKHNRG